MKSIKSISLNTSSDLLEKKIIGCSKCPELINYCAEVAQNKKKEFNDFIYWGKPVPNFGNLSTAKLLIVGLAPAAHGANRTGRMFTGDRSGLWLYRALHEFGFANQASSTDRLDGLQLKSCAITAVLKCAPPANKPTSTQLQNCSDFLDQEIAFAQLAQVYLALGKIAYEGLWRALLRLNFQLPSRKPEFKHGLFVDVQDSNGHTKYILCSYHPSQQNTFTGKLTKPMFDQVFIKILGLVN